MPFADAPYDVTTISLMSAALETACMAISLSSPGVQHVDRVTMEAAILDAVAGGQRDFAQLQQAAFDALGATAVKPVDRRQQLRLVEKDRRQR